MRSRQARKIVRMVRYTPIDRMSDTWYDRGSQWCATYRQPHIQQALRYYWNGVADRKIKPFDYKPKILMKITNNFASTIIGTVSGRITYNGRTINIPQSSRMELVDGQFSSTESHLSSTTKPIVQSSRLNSQAM